MRSFLCAISLLCLYDTCDIAQSQAFFSPLSRLVKIAHKKRCLGTVARVQRLCSRGELLVFVVVECIVDEFGKLASHQTP